MVRSDCDLLENWSCHHLGETDDEYDARYANLPDEIINAFERKEARKDTIIPENEREDTESSHSDLYMEGTDAEPGDIDRMWMDNELEDDTSNDFVNELHDCFEGFDGKVIDAPGDEDFTQSSISITWVGAREG